MLYVKSPGYLTELCKTVSTSTKNIVIWKCQFVTIVWWQHRQDGEAFLQLSLLLLLLYSIRYNSPILSKSSCAETLLYFSHMARRGWKRNRKKIASIGNGIVYPPFLPLNREKFPATWTHYIIAYYMNPSQCVDCGQDVTNRQLRAASRPRRTVTVGDGIISDCTSINYFTPRHCNYVLYEDLRTDPPIWPSWEIMSRFHIIKQKLLCYVRWTF